jgi:3-oxoacyl-[acyl-carrier protein] reductase
MSRILITGGNKGIGFHITEKFLGSGDTVTVVARDFTGFRYADDPRVQTIAYDLTDVAGIPDLIQQIGDLDVLINNAGISTGLEPEAYTAEAYTHLVNLNLAAPIALITGYAPRFIQNGGGRVVNIASQAGVWGHYDVWYGATKAGLINATKSLAAKYGRYGLVINAVAPGPVEVEVIHNVPHPERYARVKERTILKRYAQPEEVADLVYWLAKDSPVYLNGDNYLFNNLVQSLDT